MKVKELMKLLSEVDLEKDIVMEDGFGECIDIAGIIAVQATESGSIYSYPVTAYEDGCADVILIVPIDK